MDLSALLNHWALRKASPSRKILPQESIAQAFHHIQNYPGTCKISFPQAWQNPKVKIQLWVREEGKGECLPVRLCPSVSLSPRPEDDVQA